MCNILKVNVTLVQSIADNVTYLLPYIGRCNIVYTRVIDNGITVENMAQGRNNVHIDKVQSFNWEHYLLSDVN
jgi:hypothetical protein